MSPSRSPNIYNETEKANVDFTFVVAGFSFSGAGQNAGLAFTHLRSWDERRVLTNSAQCRGATRLRRLHAESATPRSSAGAALGAGAGPVVRLRPVHGRSRQYRSCRADAVPQPGAGDGGAESPAGLCAPQRLDDTPQLHIDIDQAKANTQGVALANVNSTLSAAWGSAYINDFIDRGRVKRVYMQGDAPYRMTPEDLNRWYVRTSTGAMAPFSSFASAAGPRSPHADPLQWPSRHRASGRGHAGRFSGTATQEMHKIFNKLPKAVGYELTGLSYQEQASGSQAPALYALSILVIYLCLAASMRAGRFRCR